MHYLKERVAYLIGLAEGMQINESTNEGKLLKAVIDVMEDMASCIDDIEQTQEQLGEQVDEIDEDLGEIEKIVFDDDDDDEDDDDEEEEEGFTAEIECPHCKEIIEVNADMIDDDDDTIECPECHEKIQFEWECGCGCDDCSDHDHK